MKHSNSNPIALRLLAALVLALAFTGCGEADDDDGAMEPAPEQGASEPREEGEAEAPEMEPAPDKEMPEPEPGPQPEDEPTPIEMDTPMLPIEGSVIDLLIGQPVHPATACIFERPDLDCAEVDADGAYILEIDRQGPVAVQVGAPGYAPAIVLLEVGPDGGAFIGAAMAQSEHAAQFGQLMGVSEMDPELGAFASGFRYADGSGGVAGATVELSDDSGIGPVYFNAGGIPDRALEATEQGNFGAVEFEAGTLDLFIDHPEADCQRFPGASWPSESEPDATDAVSVLVVPGHITVFGVFVCER